MSVFNILTLKVIVLIPFVVSQSTSVVPSHVCAFYGASGVILTENYTFKITDLPKRCEVAIYSYYEFDTPNMDDEHMYKKDEDAIQTLVQANIPVYMFVTFTATKSWSDIFDPKSQDVYNNLMCPLMQKIKDLQLSGIILCVTDISDGKIADYPNKMKTTISKIKEEKPTLKVGLYLGPNLFSNNNTFDFSIINSVIDMYNINMFVRGFCDDTILQSGTPIKSASLNDTLESRSNLLSTLGMDKNKIFAAIEIAVLAPDDGIAFPTVYSKYCSDVNAANSCTWCADSTQHLYDEGAFLKTKFHGVVVSYIDFDDTIGLCECQICPATNALFDGWDGAVHTECPKIDKK